MTPADLSLLRFLLASAGCFVAGAGVWGLLLLLRRRLPALAAQRSVWLLAQLTVAASFLVIALPHGERLRVVPPIELAARVDASTFAGEGAASAGTDGTSETGEAGKAAAGATLRMVPTPAATAWPAAWLPTAAQAWLGVYLLGLGWSLWRLLRGQRALADLARAGTVIAESGAPRGTRVIEVDAPVSPLLFGWFRARLLLPVHLRSFEPLQRQLMLEHEYTHLRRHDLQWLAAAVVLQTLFWFNPFMRLLRAQLAWAQELGCDRAVLANRPAAQRKAYAAALLAQLKLQPPPLASAATALAFGHGSSGNGGSSSAALLASRIGRIKVPVAGRSRSARLAACAGLAAIVGGSLALQPALAWRDAGGEHAGTAPVKVAIKVAVKAPEAGAPTASFSSSASTRTAGAGQGAAAAGSTAIDTTNAANVGHGQAGAVAGGVLLDHCMLVQDAASGATIQRDGQCDVRVTPASTFNIVVSLMGYDSGILRDTHAPRLPFKQGYVDYNPTWRQATDPTLWLKNSVLWYAQQVVAQLGAARFGDYMRRFDYGNRDVAGDPGENNGLSMSWVGSSLRISADEQAAFLRKIVNRQLPLDARAYDMTERIMPAAMLADGWRLQGKTGTASALQGDGRKDRDYQYGWFVGWASKGGRTVVFARLIRDERKPTGPAGPRAREAVLRELPAILKTL